MGSLCEVNIMKLLDRACENIYLMSEASKTCPHLQNLMRIGSNAATSTVRKGDGFTLRVWAIWTQTNSRRPTGSAAHSAESRGCRRSACVE